MKTKTPDHVIRARAAHHAALASLHPEPGQDGLKLWRKLRRLETLAHNAATAQCNAEPYGGQPFRDYDDMDEFCDSIRDRVAIIFGGTAPRGLWVNRDPRGYALKLDPDQGATIPEGMITDWGGYGILAPEIN